MPIDQLFDTKKVINQEIDYKSIRFLWYVTTDFVNGTIMHPNVQQLIHDTNEHFDVVIAEWLYSELYSGFHKKVEEYSFIYHDRLTPPGKVLSHWVSHVIRTNGAHYLRSPAFLVPWRLKGDTDWQQLDVVSSLNFFNVKKKKEFTAHPNCLLFITQGGVLSMTEAIYYGIPVVGVPIFGDQFTNTQRAVENGFAIKVELTNAMVEQIKDAIEEMLRNSRLLSDIRQTFDLIISEWFFNDIFTGYRQKVW
ncbi:unnamed protein product, partial [Iphiclides podalirius]